MKVEDSNAAEAMHSHVTEARVEDQYSHDVDASVEVKYSHETDVKNRSQVQAGTAQKMVQ